MAEKQLTSPFQAKTFEEQQRQWLLWRSAQTDYGAEMPFSHEETKLSKDQDEIIIPDPVSIPQLRPAQNRHSQLDSINARHKAAGKSVGTWKQASFTT